MLYSLRVPLTRSPISDWDFKYHVPPFPCRECGRADVALHLGYPHLNPAEILGQRELRLLDPAAPPGSFEPSALRDLCRRLEDHWGVPVTAGAFFGPLKIKVTAKPHLDFDSLDFIKSFFLRREAAEALLERGFDFDFLPAEATGRYARDADFVQVVVPIVAHCSVAAGYTYCEHCRTLGGAQERGADWVLYEDPKLQELPFFAPLEENVLLLTGDFVAAARSVGVRGLLDGPPLRVLHPVKVVPDPMMRPSTRPWPRLQGGSRISNEPQLNQGHEVVELQSKQHTSCSDQWTVDSWLQRLEGFLARIQGLGGTSRFERGPTGGHAEIDLTHVPEPLQALLAGCGGKLAFSYRLQTPERCLEGGCHVEVGAVEANCRAWAETTWIADDRDEAETWCVARAFAALQNGDFLALDGRSRTSDPVVIYLSHDDTSTVIAPSLREFLRNWEGVCYVGPEIWILDEFLDPRTGYLSGDGEAACAVRRCVKDSDSPHSKE